MLLPLLAVMATGGCATLVKGSTQNIVVESDPSGAICTLSSKGKQVAVVNPSPGTALVDKGKDSLDVRCTKPGFEDGAGQIGTVFQGMTFGNILFGGIIGLAVDAGSGAMHSFQPHVKVKLVPRSFADEVTRDRFFDRWRTEVERDAAAASAEVNKTCSKEMCPKLLEAISKRREAALQQIDERRGRAVIAAPAET